MLWFMDDILINRFWNLREHAFHIKHYSFHIFGTATIILFVCADSQKSYIFIRGFSKILYFY